MKQQWQKYLFAEEKDIRDVMTMRKNTSIIRPYCSTPKMDEESQKKGWAIIGRGYR